MGREIHADEKVAIRGLGVEAVEFGIGLDEEKSAVTLIVGSGEIVKSF